MSRTLDHHLQPGARPEPMLGVACSQQCARPTKSQHDGRPMEHNTQLSVSRRDRSEEHTSELQSPCNLVCRLLLEKKKHNNYRCSCHDSYMTPMHSIHHHITWRSLRRTL